MHLKQHLLIFVFSIAGLQQAHADYLVSLRTAYPFYKLDDIYFSDNGSDYGLNRIVRLSDSGSYLGDFVSATEAGNIGMSGPTGMIVGQDGKIYVASNYTNEIFRFTTSGQHDATISNALFDAPTALAFDSNNNLYVTNMGNIDDPAYNPLAPYNGIDATFKFQGSTVVKSAGSNLNSFSTFGTDHAAPAGLAFDANGQLYVSEYEGPSIRLYTGNDAGSLEPFTLASKPGGVAVAADGSVYYADLAGVVFKDGVEVSTGLGYIGAIRLIGDDLFILDAAFGDIRIYDTVNGGSASVWVNLVNDLGLPYASIGDILYLPVPEPGSAGLLIIGFIGIATSLRCRRRAA